MYMNPVSLLVQTRPLAAHHSNRVATRLDNSNAVNEKNNSDISCIVMSIKFYLKNGSCIDCRRARSRLFSGSARVTTSTQKKLLSPDILSSPIVAKESPAKPKMFQNVVQALVDFYRQLEMSRLRLAGK